ncbi:MULTISPECIES: cellulose binding domain-containing protein [Clostridium]|uniref:cellulose binding domain-containing protein n=1 Tax=Clostridium TaxID=1485 RepID=UPI0009BD9CB8|nr:MULTISPECIES: cellulose binding domain-containing protein [Clostridium]PJI10446.1 glucuronoarabinoxylan endo-1,4-beta-xylanase [Clostridium sp. CT7]
MNIKVKKLILSLMAVSMTCLSFAGKATSVKAASTATINVTSKDQVIRGFGASSAWCGALSDTCMDTLYKNAGLDIVRLRIAPNEGWNRGDFRAWSDELSNAKKVRARGGIVFATPWTPPASMKSNNTTTGANRGYLKPSSYADYAAYLKTFVKYMSDNGAPLYALSLQNEPDWAPDYDACTWTSQQFHDFISQYGAGLSSVVKLIMPESLGFNQALSDPILNDPNTAKYVSIIGGHLYGATIKDYPSARNKGKDIWMTEHYLEGNDPATCVKLAKEINDCMTIGNMNAYVYWWISGDQNGLYNTRTNETYKKTYVMGQFSKFIRNGYYRIDATSSPQSNVYVSAYTGDSKVVVVAINQGTNAVNQNFSMKNGSVSKVSSYVTSGSANMAKGADITATNGNFTASLPAQSVTTFVGDLNGDTPTPVPTTTKVEAPTMSVVSGTYTTAQKVSLSSSTSDAAIYYTTDGSDPTTSSTLYSGPITISKTTTLKAIAVKNGMTDSDITSADYTISTSPEPQSPVEISCSVASNWGSGASINVTIKNNGTTPINGWNLSWTLPNGQTVTNMWNGSYKMGANNAITVSSLPYNAVIAPNSTQSFGFNISYNGTFSAPTAYKLNGVDCTIK